MKINIERGSFLSSLEMGVKTKIKQSGGVVNSTPSVITEEKEETYENSLISSEINKPEAIGNSNKDSNGSEKEFDDSDFEFDMGSDEEDYTFDTEEDEDYDMDSDDDDEEYVVDSDDEEYEFPDEDDEEEYDMDSENDDDYDIESEEDEELDDSEEFEFDMDSDDEDYEFPDEDNEEEFDIGADDVEDFDMDSEDEEDYNMSSEEDSFKEPTPVLQETPKSQNNKQLSRTIPVETKDDDLNSLLNSITTPKSNVQVKSVTSSEVAENKENTGIVYHEGMKFDDFLRKNPSIRSEKDVLDYYSKEELKFYIRTGKVLFKKGRFIL